MGRFGEAVELVLPAAGIVSFLLVDGAGGGAEAKGPVYVFSPKWK